MESFSYRSPNAEEWTFLEKCHPFDLESFLQRCLIFQKFLYETNEKFNLTRIPVEEFWSKHICDSLSLACMKEEIRNQKIRLCDVGCGAGLPSLILAAAFPNLFINAIDSRGKKAQFTAEAAEKMNLSNLKAFQARSNELGHKDLYRHSFRMVTARAVGTAETLLKETSDLLSRQGELVLYRTPTQAEQEYQALMNGKKRIPIRLTEMLDLPGNAGTRMFMILEPGKTLPSK